MNRRRLTTLYNLKRGRFRTLGRPVTEGVLLKVNECRAVVQIDSGLSIRYVPADRQGNLRRFLARKIKTTSWSPNVTVEAITEEPAAVNVPHLVESQPWVSLAELVRGPFRLPTAPFSRCRLLRVADGKARVIFDQPDRNAITVASGDVSHRARSRIIHFWEPELFVEPIVEESEIMAKKTTKPAAEKKAQAAAKRENARVRKERKASADGQTAAERAMSTTAPKKGRGRPKNATAQPAKATRAKAGRPRTAENGKGMSLLDAAAQVLKKKGSAMSAAEMVEAAVKQGLWTPGVGKTPEATLYAAIYREISGKGKEARFKKTAPGQFVAT